MHLEIASLVAIVYRAYSPDINARERAKRITRGYVDHDINEHAAWE